MWFTCRSSFGGGGLKFCEEEWLLLACWQSGRNSCVISMRKLPQQYWMPQAFVARMLQLGICRMDNLLVLLLVGFSRFFSVQCTMKATWKPQVLVWLGMFPVLGAGKIWGKIKMFWTSVWDFAGPAGCAHWASTLGVASCLSFAPSAIFGTANPVVKTYQLHSRWFRLLENLLASPENPVLLEKVKKDDLWNFPGSKVSFFLSRVEAEGAKFVDRGAKSGAAFISHPVIVVVLFFCCADAHSPPPNLLEHRWPHWQAPFLCQFRNNWTRSMVVVVPTTAEIAKLSELAYCTALPLPALLPHR